ncbi:hypothetical protein SNE40_008296 [Patella caerulea]|uniref:SH2 domain-containing protein n=1 Tax=Patella caerulea TaxID=87958 RepID=A0AAN8K5B4_PATCE
MPLPPLPGKNPPSPRRKSPQPPFLPSRPEPQDTEDYEEPTFQPCKPREKEYYNDSDVKGDNSKTTPHTAAATIDSEVNTSDDDDSRDIYDDGASDPLVGFPWYHVDIGRKTSNARIHQINKDGTYLIRNSGGDKSTNASHPYTLCVLYENRIRNLKIRQRSDKKFALGEYKDNEMTFESIEKLVEHHQKNDVILLGEHQGKVKLLQVAAIN